LLPFKAVKKIVLKKADLKKFGLEALFEDKCSGGCCSKRMTI
jgi:hypothetical protein